jgi:UDP-N-acetyl-2-amino-2-deoxyglucuronate dehydrogenase
MKKHKVVIVGAGRIFKKHIDYITSKHNKFFELVAIIEKKTSKHKTLFDYNVPVLQFYKEVINKFNFETVIILTESGNHASIAEFFLKNKKNTIIEKPIAVKLKEAEKLVQLEKKFKKNVFVVKQNRFNLPIIKLKTARDQNYYNQAPWRGTYKNDGGVLCNQAIHHIDLLQWLVGGVKSVYAKKNKVSAKIQCEDLAVALMHFKNGALGTIEATTATRPNDLEGSISILGTKGSVLIKGFSANKVENWNFELQKNNNFNYNKFNENPPNVYGFGHQRFYKFVENVLKKKEKNTLNSSEGIKSLKIVTALYKSFEKKREVFMNENLYTTQLGK